MFTDDSLAVDVEAALRPATSLAVLLGVADSLRAQPHLLVSRIRRIRAHPKWFDALVDRSQRHRNGFTKIKIVETSRFSVRLHVWSTSVERRGEFNPHGHRWEFASWVVGGAGVTESFYEPCRPDEEAARAYHQYRYEAAGTGDRLLLPVGRDWLKVGSGIRRPAGTTYACDREVLHTVVPSDDGDFATVVIQGPVVQQSAPVYAEFGACPRAGERRVTPGELADDLDIVEALLTDTEESG